MIGSKNKYFGILRKNAIERVFLVDKEREGVVPRFGTTNVLDASAMSVHHCIMFYVLLCELLIFRY